MTDATAQAVDPLRLSRCPQCAYSLEGLPDAGVCPECGRAYDQQVVVLYGWAKGSRATVVNASPGLLAWLLAAQLVFPFMILLTGSVGRLPSAVYFWLLMPAAVTAVMLWKRWNSPLPAPVQVLLSAEGCLQIDPLRPAPDPAPWARVDDVTLKSTSPTRCRLTLTRTVPWWQPAPTPKVDALLQCTPAQADALRGRISAWQARAADALS